MTSLAGILSAAAAVIVALAAMLWRVWLRSRDSEAKLSRSAEMLAEVRRKANELAAGRRAQIERARERQRKAELRIHEIEGRTYEGLRREPTSPDAMEKEASDLLREAERESGAVVSGADESGAQPPGVKGRGL